MPTENKTCIMKLFAYQFHLGRVNSLPLHVALATRSHTGAVGVFSTQPLIPRPLLDREKSYIAEKRGYGGGLPV